MSSLACPGSEEQALEAGVATAHGETPPVRSAVREKR